MPFRRSAIFLGLGGTPLFAAAHANSDATGWWTLDPWVWLPMAILSALHARGLVMLWPKRRVLSAAAPGALVAFGGGMAALFFALIWPLDALGELSFAAHMAQHMLLIAVAAPLLVLAELALPVMLGVPRRWRRPLVAMGGDLRGVMRFLLLPRIAFALHAAVIWVWHAPLLFDAALRWRWVHVLEHGAFFGSALLFWAALSRLGRRGGASPGVAALWCLAMLMHTGLLGALITFAPRLLYSGYAGGAAAALLPPLEDQQLAGLLMWIPAGVCYLVAGLGLGAAWLRASERSGG